MKTLFTVTYFSRGSWPCDFFDTMAEAEAFFDAKAKAGANPLLQPYEVDDEAEADYQGPG